MTGTSATLSAVVSDDGDQNGQSDVSYAWSVTPPTGGGDAWFDDDTAASPSLHFTKAGTYGVTLDVDDGHGQTDQYTGSVTVVQTLTSIDLSPDAAAVLVGGSATFAATGIDQFGDEMATQPALTWSASAGEISGGAFTACGSNIAGAIGGTCSVTASASNGSTTVTGTATVAVQPWTVDQALDYLTFDDGGYAQSTTSTQSIVRFGDEGVTFSSDLATFLTVGPLRKSYNPYTGMTTDGSNILYAGHTYQCCHGCDFNSDGAGDMKISFDSPTGLDYLFLVGNLDASVCPSAGNGLYTVGTVTLHLAGGETVTTNLNVSGSVVAGRDDCPGDSNDVDNVGPHNDVAFGEQVFFSQYGPLTEIDISPKRIAFTNATPVQGGDGFVGDGAGGTAWCHDWIGEQEFGIDYLQLANFQPALLSLTAADDANPANQVTAITNAAITAAAIKDLYLPADADGVGHVDLTAMFSPLTFGGTGEGQYVHLMVKRGTTTIGSDYTFTNANTLSNLALAATPTAHDFSLVLWLDLDHDGYYETGEPTREVDVHVVTVDSLTVSDHNAPANTATATWTTTPDLYVAADADGNGHIDLSALFAFQLTEPDKAGRLIHVTVVRSDGQTMIDGDYDRLDDAGRLSDLVLRTTATACDFTVHCITTAGDPEEEVRVVTPPNYGFLNISLPTNASDGTFRPQEVAKQIARILGSNGIHLFVQIRTGPLVAGDPPLGWNSAGHDCTWWPDGLTGPGHDLKCKEWTQSLDVIRGDGKIAGAMTGGRSSTTIDYQWVKNQEVTYDTVHPGKHFSWDLTYANIIIHEILWLGMLGHFDDRSADAGTLPSHIASGSEDVKISSSQAVTIAKLFPVADSGPTHPPIYPTPGQSVEIDDHSDDPWYDEDGNEK